MSIWCGVCPLEVNKPLANPRRSIQHHSHHHMTRMIMILFMILIITAWCPMVIWRWWFVISWWGVENTSGRWGATAAGAFIPGIQSHNVNTLWKAQFRIYQSTVHNFNCTLWFSIATHHHLEPSTLTHFHWLSCFVIWHSLRCRRI